MDALIIRKGALGDVINSEPFIRALSGYKQIAFEAGLYSEVFENHPLLVQKSSLRGRIKEFDLTGVYEKDLTTNVCVAYLQRFGLSMSDVDRKPRLYLTEEEKNWAKVFMPGKWALFDMSYPGGSLNRGFWEFSDWRPACEFMKSKGFKIVYIGGGPYQGFLSLDLNVDSAVIDLDLRGKTTMRQMFSVVSNCSAFLGLDSGPMHCCQAFNIPGVAIFNTLHPAKFLINPISSIVPIHATLGDPFPTDDLLNELEKLFPVSLPV